MQILMTQAAHERVRGRLATIAPDAEVVTVTAADTFACGGKPIDKDDIKPEVAWMSLDSWPSGLIPSLYGRIMQGDGPKWTQVMAAGLDNPMFTSIVAKGVRVTKSSAQSVPIAEYVIGHALSLLLPIDAQASLQREHKWAMTPYREVGNTKWIIVGYGAIGHAIATRIKPFGADLTVVRRNPASDDLVDRVVGQGDLVGLLPDADVVVLACPLNDDTRGMCDAAFFAAMKPGSILINIGRGGLVDEDALRESLDRDQPAHAVLDVFQTEPLPADHWIWDHPKIRVSGHSSNSGDGNLGRGDELFLNNLRLYLAGEPLLQEAHPSEVGL